MKKTRILAISVLVLGLPAGVAKADFTFGAPTNLGPTVNSSSEDGIAHTSADGLELYFCSERPGGYGSGDLYVARRQTKRDDWGPPVNLGPTVNSSDGDYGPNLSADGLELYFNSNRPGGYGSIDIWLTTRATTDTDWSAPVNLGSTVNSSAEEIFPWVSADGLQLYFSEWEVFRPGGYGGSDMWVTTRDKASDPWGTPVNLGPAVNSSAHDDGPFITDDGLALFFSSTRPGTVDMFMTRWAMTDNDWGTPVNLGPAVNSSYSDNVPRISADCSTLYFISNRSGGYGDFDIWQASIEPVVDLNGDGIVDSADMGIMIDHWGTDEPLCDIGPMPWGDGMVDVQDLIVLAEHLLTCPGAVAYWKLDETEGEIAYDSIGVYDGALSGVPTWQPTAGMVDGALQFDGIDDYVSTEFVLNPAEGPFSIFAWVMGGVPGQVVLSQADGENWLCADSVGGNLMTELVPPAGRLPSPPLVSESTITDGNWHRIAFVWDGSYRHLYVDGTEVAKDAALLSSLKGALGGLYFGAGSTLAPGTLWSGLIDDIRIYSRAVNP